MSVLEKLCGQPVKVIGAGRTDAGVHAKCMTANVHMEVPREYSPIRVRDYLNRYLPDDICVREVTEAPEGQTP